MTAEEIISKYSSHQEYPSWYHEYDIEQMMEQYRLETIYDCQEALLKQLYDVTFENGYPVDAVPKSVILSLPALMGIYGPEKQMRKQSNDAKS